jgi:mannose-1-phosphate guanylyltransferase/mannose-6-phosphate isomerase
MTIKSVILSGGSGTRLWPASRESYPKQLLPLTGEHSLLQETALRLKDFPGGEVDPRPLVVTNEEYRFIIAEQLRQIGVRSPQIVLEPVGATPRRRSRWPRWSRRRRAIRCCW